MVQCGWMAYHTCGHVSLMWTCMHMCMWCFDGAGVWFPVSLSGTHAPIRHARTSECICLGFLCRCLGAPHAQHSPHVGGAPAGVVPHVLWIVDHACKCTARSVALHTRGAAHAGDACSHAHIHRREAPAGRVPHGLWIMHACAPHIYTHTHAHNISMCMLCSHMHILVACSSHAHTHTYMHVWTCIHVLLHAHHIHTYTCMHVTHTHIHVDMHTCVTHPEATQHVGAAYIST